MGEKEVEEGAEYTSLPPTSAEGYGFKRVFANVHILWSVTKEVQNPFA